MQAKSINKNLFLILLGAAAILLSLATVYIQVNDVTLHFLRVQQDKVHQEMMEGIAGNPWQYRILADWMIDLLIRFAGRLGISRPEVSTFIAFRFLQCVLIFLVAGIYYRKLGLPLFANLLGLSILAWGLSYSLYNSDLSFNVYFDIVFYIIAAILIMDKKFIWVLPLMLLAAFNRETSGLIPFMLISFAYFGDDRKNTLKPAIFYAMGCLVIFGGIFFGLRLYYGDQPFLTANGYYPGLGLFAMNILNGITWEQLLITLGIIPGLAIIAYRSWPTSLKIFFWTVVPAWFLVHFFAAIITETRLLLVPQALIFIPAALFGIPFKNDTEENPT
jgi:hypothetical protein